MADLSAADRKKLPPSDFAVRSRAGSAERRAESGSYPIPDRNHARLALARSAGKPEAAQVRAAVERKYPGMVKKGKK